MKKAIPQNPVSALRIIRQTSWLAESMHRAIKHTAIFFFQLFRLSNSDMNPL